MDVSIILFPGTNRERDMALAFESVTGRAPKIVWHKDTEIGNPDLIVLPGGFSYGDYLRCGAMAAHSPVMRTVIEKARRGTPLLGVCNGFQILVETGLVPGALLRNRGLKFSCRQVRLRCEAADTLFTRGLEAGQVLRMPIAHGEGQYFAPPETIKAMEDGGQIAFRYVNDNGETGDDANPNGSVAHIAGVLNGAKNILGMMPHPENATQPWQLNRDDPGAVDFFRGIAGVLK